MKRTLAFIYSVLAIGLLAVGVLLWVQYSHQNEEQDAVRYGKHVEQERMQKTPTKGTTGPVPTDPIVKVEPIPPKSVLLDAPVINQNPLLDNGCEVTSLTMMLRFAGLNVDKMELADAMPKDPTPLRRDANGRIVFWGNPNIGFVGDVTGRQPGYAIYHRALHAFASRYIKTAVDLTGSPYKVLEQKLAQKKPLVVWTTTHYDVPRVWQQWDTEDGPIRATREEHAVLLVGYDEKYVYVNDPLSVRKNQRIEKSKFKRGWKALGRQAISY